MCLPPNLSEVTFTSGILAAAGPPRKELLVPTMVQPKQALAPAWHLAQHCFPHCFMGKREEIEKALIYFWKASQTMTQSSLHSS